METKLLDADQPGAIESAAQLLSRGFLVAYPTDTLYGVGANAVDQLAVESLYRAKRRPREKGIPILIADPSDLDKIVEEVPTIARQFINRYWPGPLTLILPKRAGLPAAISPNLGVATRIPDHDVARRLIASAGGTVATSSVNRSGEKPAQSAKAALTALKGSLAAVLDGGSVHYGQASTIVDCTSDPPRMVRDGPITASELGLEGAVG